MLLTQLTAEEIGRRGQNIYDQQIRPHVEAGNRGRFLVLDIETGEYEIDADDLTASERLLERLPEAQLYGVRVGHPTAYRFGGRRLAGPL